MAFARKGELQQALSEYQETLKIAFFSPDIYKAMPLTAKTLKDYRQAINSMTAHLELSPEAHDAREVKDKIIK